MRVALGVEYNGSRFYGWQAQANLPTVQGAIEKALSQIADHAVQVFCAGRTDAGVHATGQVIHFETTAQRDARAWVFGTNSNLPPDISICWAKEVDADFHARFSAIARRYYYVIYNKPVRSAIFHSHITLYQSILDAEVMHLAAQHLVGEHDFSAFRSAQCESRTPMRCVNFVNVFRKKDFVIIEIEANAFLHHMVRNITGVLLKIGCGSNHKDWTLELLNAKDRAKAAETAPPTGLYLAAVKYPAVCNIPDSFGHLNMAILSI